LLLLYTKCIVLGKSVKYLFPDYCGTQ
jgi:hypothetical protein